MTLPQTSERVRRLSQYPISDISHDAMKSSPIDVKTLAGAASRFMPSRLAAIHRANDFLKKMPVFVSRVLTSTRSNQNLGVSFSRTRQLAPEYSTYQASSSHVHGHAITILTTSFYCVFPFVLFLEGLRRLCGSSLLFYAHSSSNKYHIATLEV